MFEVYKFPYNFLSFWHIGARSGVNDIKSFLKRFDTNKKILDIGAGGGWISLLAGLLGFNVTALDINRRSLEETKKISKKLKIEKNIKTIVGDCYSLPFPKESYDIIISSHIIEHLDNPKLMVKESSRVLKKGGILFLSCPSSNHNMRISKWVGYNLDPEDHVVLGYNEKTLKTFLPNDMSIKKVSYGSRFLLSNLSDIQIALSRLFKIKANTQKREYGVESKNTTLIKVLYVFKEIFLLILLPLCKLEDILFFYIRGSSISMEIIKNEV